MMKKICDILRCKASVTEVQTDDYQLVETIFVFNHFGSVTAGCLKILQGRIEKEGLLSMGSFFVQVASIEK